MDQSLIVSGFKDKDALAQFFRNELGYMTTPVFYEAADLGIPPYLAREVVAWWLLSHYPGRLPFQIHLAQIKTLMFYPCRNIAVSLPRQHPGYYLFIFTKDYNYLVFMTIEWSLERRPWSGRSVWLKLPKAYPRLLLVDRNNPTQNDVVVLNWLRIEEPSDTNPLAIYENVLQALKLSQPAESWPEWFVPYYCRLGGILQFQQVIIDVRKCLAEAQEILSGCLATESIWGIDEACECLVDVMQSEEFAQILDEQDRGRLEHAINKLTDAEALCEEDDREQGLVAIQEAIFAIEYVRIHLYGQP